MPFLWTREAIIDFFLSKDILSRWTFPLVPDDNHPGGHVYQHTRGNKYIATDNSVSLARCVFLFFFTRAILEM